MLERSLLVPLIALCLAWVAGPAQAREFTHEVLPGESAASIAKEYGISVRALRRRNAKELRHGLRAGQKLRIASRTVRAGRHKTKYTVRRGDTPAAIAKQHGMSLSQLRRLNTGVGKRPLRIGQALWVAGSGGGEDARARGPVDGLIQMGSGPGYVVREGDKAWGTFLTTSRLTDVLSAHARRFPNATPVRIDDISKRRGGFLAPHHSHRRGRDVDIRYPMTVESDRYVEATPENLDLARTWDLLQRFASTGDVPYIFVDYRLQQRLYTYAEQQKVPQAELDRLFQYPHGRRSMAGIIRHEKGHRTHFHVRFAPDPRPEEPTS